MSRVLSFIGIKVPEPFSLEIRKFQAEIEVKEKINKALRIPVHITLIPPFYTGEDDLLDLAHCLSRARQDYLPMRIEARNFGVFLPRVVFVDVVRSPELVFLQNDLQERLQEDAFIEAEKQYREYRPHITIASKSLTKKLFAKAWEKFSYMHYDASWVAEEFIRYQHIDGIWVEKESYPFLS